MQCKQKAVERALESKGFVEEKTHHRYYVYWTVAGRKTTVRTYTSHGNPDLNDYLLGKMAEQCRLTKAQFVGLVDCPFTRDDFEGSLSDQGLT